MIAPRKPPDEREREPKPPGEAAASGPPPGDPPGDSPGETGGEPRPTAAAGGLAPDGVGASLETDAAHPQDAKALIAEILARMPQSGRSVNPRKVFWGVTGCLGAVIVAVLLALLIPLYNLKSEAKDSANAFLAALKRNDLTAARALTEGLALTIFEQRAGPLGRELATSPTYEFTDGEQLEARYQLNGVITDAAEREHEFFLRVQYNQAESRFKVVEFALGTPSEPIYDPPPP